MMRYEDNIRNQYFNWIYDLICHDRFSDDISYLKLITYLHNVEFRYSIAMDKNRAADGTDLRWRFVWETKKIDIYEDLSYLEGPCSVLEMMVALAIRCEETIMDDTRYGNRTSQWFWGMVTNLGLGSMTDDAFDRRYVSNVVNRFLDREYEPDGRGGLFTIRDRDQDLRDVEIWYQLCWYLDNIS